MNPELSLAERSAQRAELVGRRLGERSGLSPGKKRPLTSDVSPVSGPSKHPRLIRMPNVAMDI
ncbi:hypothetical protein PM082_008817 [Marasmius tenuissimus]|nr:hypothetical protein PM082_008817 [Marasmius tenuissimus]